MTASESEWLEWLLLISLVDYYSLGLVTWWNVVLGLCQLKNCLKKIKFEEEIFFVLL